MPRAELGKVTTMPRGTVKWFNNGKGSWVHWTRRWKQRLVRSLHCNSVRWIQGFTRGSKGRIRSRSGCEGIASGQRQAVGLMSSSASALKNGLARSRLCIRATTETRIVERSHTSGRQILCRTRNGSTSVALRAGK